MSLKMKRGFCLILACLLVLAAGTAVQAQTKQFMTWMQDLNYLEKAADDDLARETEGIVQIRAGVELWIRMHPGTAVTLAAAPDRPWDAAALRGQVTELKQAVRAIIAEDPARPFQLGVTSVSVTSEASPLSPIAESVEQNKLEQLHLTNVGTALDYIPGVSLDRSANRNEAQIRLRGFSNRGQIPLYLDGIPIQVPYDGTIDFSRFLTGDISEIQVAKGYSSPLMGANNLGGSINLVSKEPKDKFDGEAMIGTGSGDALLASMRLGSRWDKFYFQGTLDWNQKDYIPLSGDFAAPAPNQPDFKLNNSDSRDAKYGGRIGFTPRGEDQYVFSYINQKAEKSQPRYSGYGVNARNRYWRWPEWNKTSYYVITNTGIGDSSSIKLRLYYDQFKNALASYDDDTYSTMTKRSAFYSVYDDHAGGASVEFNTRLVPRNNISASFFFKDDSHKSYDLVPFRTATTLDRIQTFSFGFQDVITFTSKVQAIVGFNIDHLKGLQAMELTDDDLSTRPIICESNPNNDSFAGCTPNAWLFSPQVSLSYSFTQNDKLFATFSDRGRFPLMKELYTSSFRKRLPNPDLDPEYSRNWNFGWSHVFSAKTMGQIEFFRSDMRNAINDVYVPDPGNFCEESRIPGACEQYANVAEEDHYGVEMSLRSTPFSRLTLDGSYSFLERSIVVSPDVQLFDPDRMILPTLPKHKVIINAALTLPRDILLLGTWRFEGALHMQDPNDSVDHDNDPATPRVAPPISSTSFGTVDLGAVAPIYGGMSLQVGLKNLFDRNYFYNPGYPEAGRNWYFNMRYKF